MDYELLDVLDERMNVIRAEKRERVHELGFCHQTFHCWIVQEMDGEKYLLFQKRSKNKDTFPCLYDISCAGHLSSGEKPEDGVREIQEELGLEVKFDDLKYAGMVFQEKRGTDFIDREFNHIYIYFNNTDIKKYKIQVEEIQGLFRAKLFDVIDLIEGKVKNIKLVGFEMDKLNICSDICSCISKEQVVPHSNEYFKRLFNALKTYINKI